MMKNLLNSIFNFGDISQNNTIIVNTLIDTQLNQIKRTFSEGKISISFNDIIAAKKEHVSNEKARYHFIMLETQFYFTLRNFDKVYENLEYIEENLSKYLEINFYEVKASIASLNKNKKEFDSIVLKIQKEFNGDKSPKEYFEMIFLLNSNQPNEAKSIYEDYVARTQIKDKRIDFMGGMIYANLYSSTNNDNFFKKSEKIFNNYLADYQTGIFDKLEIYKIFSYDAVNKIHNAIPIDNYKTIIKQTKDTLDLIMDDISYFGLDSQNILKNHYLHCLWILKKKDLFVEKYQQMEDEEIDSINFVSYNLILPTSEVDYSKIEERILVDKNVLIPYLDNIIKTNPERLLLFLSSNKEYLQDEIVLNIYIEAQILKNKDIDLNSEKLVEKNKNNSLISFLTYLNVRQIKDECIDNKLLDKLLKYFNSKITHDILILKAMHLLSQNNRPKDFIELSLKYKDSNRRIIKDTLELILEDKNVYLIDFEKYLKEIDTVEYSITIGNIYMKYAIFTKAYSFYQIAWEKLDFDDKSRINFACTVLQNCSIQNFFKTHGTIINQEQDMIYLSFVESHMDTISIEECFVVSYYMIVVNKSYNIGFRYINKKLLDNNIDSLSTQEKTMMSSLYFYTLTNINPEKLLVESNILIKKGEQYYLSDTLIKSIHDSHHFNLLSKVKFDLLMQENHIEKLSIFHQICNKFIYSMDNENVITIKSTPEDPIGNLKEFIIQQANDSKDILLRYSEGANISFYQMAGKYESYFKLIPTLYESNTINFNTGNNNPTLENTKKILTLSSIIFIDYMKKLDVVLARNDIYIQQTTVDFLLGFINTLSGQTEIFTVDSDGKDLFRNIADENDIKQDKDYLIYLATKITEYERIIDDREVVLALADSEKMLAPHIGYQEYRALAYSFNHDYQIITEDRIIKTMFEELGYNTNMVSNSVFLLVDDINNNVDLLVSFYEKLHSKKYKYILNENTIKDMFQKFIFEEHTYLAKGYTDKLLKCVISIAYSYGWMAGFENYYKNNYEFKIGMSSAPKKDFIARNIEYLREESNYFNEDDFPEQAISGLEQANKEAILSDNKVYVSENGFIYEKSGKNEKKFLKRTDKKIPVDTSKKLVLE